MTGNPFFSAVMEEYQISFAQVSLTYFMAILGTLVIRVTFQFFVVYLLYKCEVSPEQSTPRLLLPPPR